MTRIPEQDLWGRVFTLAVEDALGVFSIPTQFDLSDDDDVDDGQKKESVPLIPDQYEIIRGELTGATVPTMCRGTGCFKTLSLNKADDLWPAGRESQNVSSARVFINSGHAKNIADMIGYGSEFVRRTRMLVDMAIGYETRLVEEFAGKKVFPNHTIVEEIRVGKDGVSRKYSKPVLVKKEVA